MPSRILALVLVTTLTGCTGGPFKPWTAKNDYQRFGDPERSETLTNYPWMLESKWMTEQTGYGVIKTEP